MAPPRPALNGKAPSTADSDDSDAESLTSLQEYELDNGIPQPADPFIANLDEICEGKGLHMEAMKDGSFKLVNSRNKYEKGYK